MAPIIQNTSGRTFTSSRSIQLGTDCENALIHFCLDNGTWQDYSKPFIIDKRTKIYSYASLPSGEKSDTSFAEFSRHRIMERLSLKINLLINMLQEATVL